MARRPVGAVTCTLLLGSLACTPPPEPTAGAAVPVAASVPPLAELVERLGGEEVEVWTILPADASPHSWEPSPRQVAALEGARLVVGVGRGDFPLERRALAVAAAGGSGAERVEMALTAHAGGEEDGEDPHLWLSPPLYAATAGRVAEALGRLDPAHSGEYAARLEALEAEIASVDGEIRRRLAGLEGRRFYVDHPAWGHFASRYGLEQVSLAEGGRTPGPARLVELVEQARADRVRVLFVERGGASRSARVFAREVGARVVPLDPLARGWADNLRRTAEEIARALAPRQVPAGAEEEGS